VTWNWDLVDLSEAITNGLLIAIYLELVKIRSKGEK
jgi:hypothetical protein